MQVVGRQNDQRRNVVSTQFRTRGRIKFRLYSATHKSTVFFFGKISFKCTKFTSESLTIAKLVESFINVSQVYRATN